MESLTLANHLVLDGGTIDAVEVVVGGHRLDDVIVGIVSVLAHG